MTSPIDNKLTLSLDGDWDVAMEAVDYPVMIKPLFYDYDAGQMEATGTTNTGRDSQFFGVVVDRNKNGELSTIACVTDTYSTIPPAETYHSLMKEMEEMGIDGTPSYLYVSGSGGRQVLTVDIEGQMAPNCQDEIGMAVQLLTSLDGTKKHSIRLVAYNKTTDAELVGITTEEFNINARHTKTIRERHIAFQSTIMSMVGQWNDVIAPALAMMFDAKFDRQAALTLLENIMEDANIPERHRKNATTHYTSSVVDGDEHSIYQVMSGLSTYLSTELGEKPERAEKLRGDINKRARKHINKALAGMGFDSLK
jgi:hypothetical protein